MVTSEIDLGYNSKGDSKVYRITCNGNICRDVSVQLEVSRGDADLYGNENQPPHISGSDCDSCTICRSRSSNLIDSCIVTTNSKQQTGMNSTIIISMHYNFPFDSTVMHHRTQRTQCRLQCQHLLPVSGPPCRPGLQFHVILIMR